MNAEQPPIDPELLAVRRLAFRAVFNDAMRRKTRVAPLLAIFLVIIFALQITADQWLGANGSDELLLAGAQINLRVLSGQWWRLFTAPLLHADFGHLLNNVVLLYVIGRPVEAAYNSARFWLIFLGAALGGGAAALQQGTLLLGASGAVMGLLGALAILGVKTWFKLTPPLRLFLIGAPLLLLALRIGVDSLGGATEASRLAHLGGALGGIAMAAVLRPQLRSKRTGPDGMGLVAWGAAVFALGAVLLGCMRIGAHYIQPPFAKGQFEYAASQIGYPMAVQRGIWRDGDCQGDHVDSEWTLRTERILCFRLPLGGLLLIGQRQQLLSQDQGDDLALRQANDSGKFTWRQAKTMLYPLGTRHLYVLQAAESLLPGFAVALQGILPPAHLAQVGGEALPLWLLPIELPRAMILNLQGIPAQQPLWPDVQVGATVRSELGAHGHLEWHQVVTLTADRRELEQIVPKLKALLPERTQIVPWPLEDRPVLRKPTTPDDQLQKP